MMDPYADYSSPELVDIVDPKSTHVSTDCRSEDGITCGLIDSLITISRVLAPRLRENRPHSSAICQSLKDLIEDEDVQTILQMTGRVESLTLLGARAALL